jgi:hypothetical protein
MVINYTDINKTNNHLSHKESLNSVVINYTNINKTNNHLSPKESLNSVGHQLHWHQQNKQSPLT